MSELRRLVDLVPYLAARPVVAVEKAAADFGVQPKRILHDLEILQFVGLPGYLPGDLFEVDLDGARADGYIMARNVDALARPLRLNPDQVVSLSVALKLIVEMGAGHAAASALEKLEQLSIRATSSVAVTVEAGAPDIRTALAAAVAKRLVVTIEYGEVGSERRAVVEPHRLRTDSGFAYLDAWSRERDDWRTFRLDRVHSAEQSDETFDVRPLPDTLDTWFADVSRELTLEVTESGRWCADYHPTSAVHELGDRWRITFPLANQEWAVSLLLRLGEHVLSVSDPDIEHAARERARAALANYGS
ncbi:YafY family protein [Tessaracoccus sp. OH4464_COT-324]|uniref:helix-turn-helix transcriptional regulator n=1 Tax=Tessaracoccus sp. OH4464_COT-324 TaxID=2491059 RepID=UPI000F644045|nr:WYL domain-containing protein [Tessaracoccus sp. OH4464_COT-324]RRD47522.1 WYL domain-containing protein [Tessaracoccus sp. OH4464_COT-324]